MFFFLCRVFGTWPMALLSANRKRVVVEGPVCESSQVLGWHLRKINNETETKPPIHISSFAFNSSILWDPERWGRPSSVEGTKQVFSLKVCIIYTNFVSIKFY